MHNFQEKKEKRWKNDLAYLRLVLDEGGVVVTVKIVACPWWCGFLFEFSFFFFFFLSLFLLSPLVLVGSEHLLSQPKSLFCFGFMVFFSFFFLSYFLLFSPHVSSSSD